MGELEYQEKWPEPHLKPGLMWKILPSLPLPGSNHLSPWFLLHLAPEAKTRMHVSSAIAKDNARA